MKTLFVNAIIVDETKEYKGELLVENGKVKAIGLNLYKKGSTIVDCQGKYLLPGFVDMHFHCRVPGNVDREDFDTATMAAARGGVTTLAEMPISKPSPCNKERFKARVEYAKKRAVVDFAFYGTGGNLTESEALELAKSGAIGYKIFLHAKPKGREDEFENLCVTGTKELYYSLYNNGKTGLITAVHCEDDGLINAISESYGGDKKSYKSQRDCRISGAEALAIMTTGMVAKEADARVHICHVATKDGIDAIEYLKVKGVSITSETCPPYILMDEEVLRKFGGVGKINPPIRGREHKQALKEGMKKGIINAIASDHAPFLAIEKDREDLDFLDLPAGMPSVEFLGISMIDKVLEGFWSFSDLVRWMSVNPAKLLGISDKKGSLNLGMDADFILVDKNTDTTTDIAKLFTKSKESCFPFEGKIFKGKIEATYVRGELVYKEDQIFAKKGYGEFVAGLMYEENID